VTAPKPTVLSDGRAETGKVEKVNAVLGYLGAARSTTFRYPGAEYLKVHFSRLLMLPGDYLTVSNANHSESHRIEGDAVGAVVGTVLGNAGGWAMSVTGDTAIVELHQVAPDLLGLRATLADLGVTADQVARGFTTQEREATSKSYQLAKKRAATSGREESVCGSDDKSDAICYKTADPVVYQRSKAVVRLLINGVELCTAFRVGTNNRLLTNHHCIANQREAADVEVWFNYQCARCGGFDVFRPTKVWVDQVVLTDTTLDYTLFSVTDFPQVEKFGYLDLDVRRATRGEELYIPQHPAGAPAMVAISSDRDRAGNCQVESNEYEGYTADSDLSYYCDTEGGSSGSPVLSRRTNGVVALHHFGGCPNSGVRIDLIYKAIATKL
jgi:hypothetical protein